MVQIHVTGREVLDAPGLFGGLGVDHVHLAWASWAVAGLLLLVTRFPRNPWLWLTLVIAAWDAFWCIFPGDVPLAQANLQFIDSVFEIGVLNLAFALQLGRTYNAWLARAFPYLPERLLIDTTGRLEELRLREGERLERPARAVYIVTRGRGLLLRQGPGGHEILLRVLGPGEIVFNGGTLVAETTLEMLALPSSA